MKLQVSIDGKTYEVEVEVAEDDYPPQSQDNHPAPATATIQSTVLRIAAQARSISDPDPMKPICAAALWLELWSACRWLPGNTCSSTISWSCWKQ